MTSSTSAADEMRKLYDLYMDAVDRRDWEAYRELFAYPWVWESMPRGAMVIDDHASYMRMIQEGQENLKDKGWVRSQIDNIRAYPTALDAGLITVDVTRHRADGSVVERKRGLYMLRRIDGRWKIVIVVDTPQFQNP